MEKAQKSLHKKKIRVITDTTNIGRTEYDAPSSDFNIIFEKPQKPGKITVKTLKYTENFTITVPT
jgi:hypothetical protein